MFASMMDKYSMQVGKIVHEVDEKGGWSDFLMMRAPPLKTRFPWRLLQPPTRMDIAVDSQFWILLIGRMLKLSSSPLVMPRPELELTGPPTDHQFLRGVDGAPQYFIWTCH